MATEHSLKSLVKRRHPDYALKKGHWEFMSACYSGGREWFTSSNIFKYLKEGDGEFADRIARAYRFNHSREIVDLVSKYLFKSEVSYRKDDASSAVKDFWKRATLGGRDIKHYRRQLSDKSSIYGRIWVVVDSSKSGNSISLADERQDDGRIYSYIVSPQNALDMAFDELGELKWILIHEQIRDDDDPFDNTNYSLNYMQDYYRLWTRNEWYLFKRIIGSDNEEAIEEEASGTHGLGVVPVFPVDHITTDESLYSAPSLIGDIAYLDRAVANYLSNLDAIIQDQTFSQLAMPAQGLMPGHDDYEKLVHVGTKRIFLYDGENGGKPFYLSPDPRQAELVVVVIKQIINEIYHTVGMAGERTKQDNSVGIDNSSGVAKAYDFERVNALLSSKAETLAHAENKLIELVNLWANQENKIDEPLVTYPRDFNTRGLHDEFEIASNLHMIEAPVEVRREQMKQVIEKLFPQLKKDLKKEMISDLEEWGETEDPKVAGSLLDKVKLSTTENTDPSSDKAKGSTTENAQDSE